MQLLTQGKEKKRVDSAGPAVLEVEYCPEVTCRSELKVESLSWVACCCCCCEEQNYLHPRRTNFLFQFRCLARSCRRRSSWVRFMQSQLGACLLVFLSARSRSKFLGRLGGCTSPTLSGGGPDEFVEGVTSVVWHGPRSCELVGRGFGYVVLDSAFKFLLLFGRLCSLGGWIKQEQDCEK